MGVTRIIHPGDYKIPEIAIPASKIDSEIKSLENALDETVAELTEMRDSASKRMGGPVAKIFDAQLMIASDADFLKRVNEQIKKKRRNSGFIFNKLINESTLPLRRSSDAYLRQTALDIEAVGKRVLSHLSGQKESTLKFGPNTIVIGKSFSPGEILVHRQRKAIGFVVSEGGKNSHMALIARGLMLPVMIHPDAHLQFTDNTRIILDGVNSKIILNPAEAVWNDYQKLKKRLGAASITRLKRLTKLPPKTADNVELQIGANLTLPGPADEILSTKKIPVGLYRTEFMYLAANRFPSEEEQYEFYYDIAKQYKHTTVTLRAFDLGYDKLATNGNWLNEENPALGLRGIRILLDMPEIFKTQIRAMLRASVFRNLKIMLPMISDISEIEQAKKLIQQVKFKLKKEKIDFDHEIELGIMVEVPSIALTADLVAQKVDFMSIGTNDLTQYTLATDRMNNKLAHLYSAYHPSVLHLVCKTVKACHKANIPVSICGEIAGEPLALPMFIGMGVSMLSMNPGKIFDLCRLIPKIDSSLARHLTESVVTEPTLNGVMKKLQNYKLEIEKHKNKSRRK